MVHNVVFDTYGRNRDGYRGQVMDGTNELFCAHATVTDAKTGKVYRVLISHYRGMLLDYSMLLNGKRVREGAKLEIAMAALEMYCELHGLRMTGKRSVYGHYLMTYSAKPVAVVEQAETVEQVEQAEQVNEAGHYLITDNGAVFVADKTESDAMATAKAMGIAAIVTRIDKAMSKSEWNAATLPADYAEIEFADCLYEYVTVEHKTTESPVWGQPVSGYGRAIPTPHMVKWNGKWRRVYCAIFGNAGSLYIGKPGQWLATIFSINGRV